MKIDKVTMSKEKAIKALREYRAILNTKRKDYLKEVELAKKCYYQLSRGRAIIDIVEAFKTAGYNEKNEPRLAFAPADKKIVFFRQDKWDEEEGRGKFGEDKWYSPKIYLSLPNGTFKPIQLERERTLSNKVPLIPPKHLPKSLTNCYLLWEVSDWKIVTKDPILLKKISGTLYAVKATWNLTKLERLIIAGR